MKPRDLLLKCYAEKIDENQWQAFCIDFGLAVQGENIQEVREKLSKMIGEYLYDALVGEDKEFADQLLNRKAPLKQIVKFYYYKTMFDVGILKEGMQTLFKTPIPMVPQACYHE